MRDLFEVTEEFVWYWIVWSSDLDTLWYIYTVHGVVNVSTDTEYSEVLVCIGIIIQCV